MVLHPLEFSECFLDSPWFRQSIREYEDELERTNTQIKHLIKDAKAMLQASRKQGEMMHVFSDRLQKFKFDIIGENLTDDERGIAGSLKEFGTMLEEIEGEWSRTIERSELQLIQPLENFRKEHIHSYREAKKSFDKTSERYYKQMEQTLGLSHKKKENQLLEADNELIIQKRNFHETSLNYVYKLQEVQERKKFEFVEHLLMFMQVYFNFYHQTHETAIDCKDYMNDIQMRLVSTRSQYEGTRDKTHMLMRKMMANPSVQGNRGDKNTSPHRVVGQRWARAGYLQLLEKNSLGSRFAGKWTRFFCMYTKENKLFQMLPPVTQSSSSSSNVANRIASANSNIAGDPLIVLACVRRPTDSIDRRFCFDIDVEDSHGKQSTLTLQALDGTDRKKWIAVMDGREPNYITTNEYRKPDQFNLNETSMKFVRNVIAEIERRGVDTEGIYRLVGVSSKVEKLLQIVMDPGTFGNLNYQDESEWEMNTLTSALKNFFRNLPEPIMTFDLHEDFIMAAKRENPEERLNRVIGLVAKLSKDSQLVLKVLIRHLVKVSDMSATNKMTVQNIGVCFGPTLMRPKQETVQSIMEIKFNNIIVEILIENYEAIFGDVLPTPVKTDPSTAKPIDRLPSHRFRGRPKGIYITEHSRGESMKTKEANSLHPSQTDTSRFHRGHAFRGPPGRPLSPRSQMKVVNAKTDSDNEDGSQSSSDNMDDFGRMSPLDLKLNFDHHFPSTREVTSDPPSPRFAEPPATEKWRQESNQRSMKSTPSPKPRHTRSEIGRKPSMEKERVHTSYSVVHKKTENTNNNNIANLNHPRSPTVMMRKEKLLDSMRRGQPSSTAHQVTSKSSIIRRRKTPLQNEKPEVKPTKDEEHTPIDIEKLKEKFSPQKEVSVSSHPDASGDHGLSFLWPKPGSIKPDTFVESSVSKQTRPRSTVISSRETAAKTPSTEIDTIFDQNRLTGTKSTDSSPTKPRTRVFETLFACEAEHESELSFGPGQVITDVVESDEPGWLVGSCDRKRGLIPSNYVREKLWD